MSAELDHVGVVPEQRLLRDLQLVTGVLGNQPGGDRASFGAYLGMPVRRAAPAPFRAEQPRTFAPARMSRVLLLDHQLMAGSGQQFDARPAVHDGLQRSIVDAAGPDGERVVLD